MHAKQATQGKTINERHRSQYQDVLLVKNFIRNFANSPTQHHLFLFLRNSSFVRNQQRSYECN